MRRSFALLFASALNLIALGAHADGDLKVGIIQPVIRPGDFNYTLTQHLQSTKRLAERGARLIVAPEGIYPGYPSNDMMFYKDFMDRSQQAAEAYVQATKGLDAVLVFGNVAKNPNKAGASLQNFLEVVHQGKNLHRRAKILLPTYGPFDDARYFDPGKIGDIQLIEVDGFKIAIGICEELWFYDPGPDGRLRYHHNPIAKIKKLKPDLVISINASPFQTGKARFRIEGDTGPGGGVARRLGVPVIYVNQAGVVDHLVFDGNSFGTDAKGKLAFKLNAFAADEAIVSVPKDPKKPMYLEVNHARLQHIESELDQVIQATEFWIREFLAHIGHDSVVFGLSGGLDSAMTTVFSAKALGPEKVFVIMMPSKVSTSGSITHSQKLIKNLGIPAENVLEIPIVDIVEAYYATLEKAGLSREFLDSVKFATTAVENIQARTRMALEFFISNLSGEIKPEMKPIVDMMAKKDPRWANFFSKRKAKFNTSDKSEMLIGNGTIFGDVAGVGGPNLDKYKTELFALGYRYNELAGRELIPLEILTKEPSPELMAQQLTTDLYPPYSIMDPLLMDLHEHGMSPAELHAKYDGWNSRINPKFGSFVDFMLWKYTSSEFKRELAQMPAPKNHPTSVGKERRVTISVKKFGPVMTPAECLKALQNS